MSRGPSGHPPASAEEPVARRGLAAHWPALALGTLVLVTALLLWTQGIRVGLWSPDEEYFVQLSRLLADNFPDGVWHLPVNDYDDRGMQRVTLLLLAVPLSAVNGETGFEIARAIFALAFASAAVPAYLLVRGLRLSPGWALAAAALVVAVPWAVLTGSFLAESVAYPMALWAVYGAWRATVTTGVRADLLAVGLAVAAAFTRTNFIVLVGLAPVAVVLQAFLSAGAATVRGRAREALGRVPRDHPILAALFGLGVGVVVLNVVGLQPGPLSDLSGNYVTSLTFDPSPLPEKFAFQFARMTVGVGVLPALVGVPWLFRNAGRSSAPESRGLALVCLLALVTIVLTTVYSAAEERYLTPIVPLIVVPAVVALARREVHWWAVAVMGAGVALLVGRQAWPFAADPARFLNDPANTFFSRVVMTRTSAGVVAVVIALAGIALALAWRRPRSRAAVLATGVAVVTLLVVQLFQTHYAVTKYAQLSAGPANLGERTWIDDAVPDGDRVALLSEGAAADPEIFNPISRELAYWNRRVDRFAGTADMRLQIPRYAQVVRLAVSDSGALRPVVGPSVPSWIVETTLFQRVGIVADEVRQAKPGYLPLRLVRVRRPLRATFLWDGTDAQGRISPDPGTATARIYPAALEGARRACLAFTLVAPPGDAGVHRYTVRAGRRTLTGGLRPGARRAVEVPLDAGTRILRLRPNGRGPAADGQGASMQVADTRVTACST